MLIINRTENIHNKHRIFHTYPLCITALTFQDSSKWWSQTNATNPWWRRLNSGQFQINHLSSSSSTTPWPEQWKATARSLIDMFCSAAVVMSTPSFFSIKPPPSPPLWANRVSYENAKGSKKLRPIAQNSGHVARSLEHQFFLSIIENYIRYSALHQIFCVKVPSSGCILFHN